MQTYGSRRKESDFVLYNPKLDKLIIWSNKGMWNRMRFYPLMNYLNRGWIVIGEL